MRRAKPMNLIATAATMFAALFAIVPAAHAATDLDGVWRIAQPSVSLQPVRGEVPFTQEGRARYAANQASRENGDFAYDLAQARCSSPGPSRMMLTSDRLRILELPTQITLQFEWNRLFRQVNLLETTAEEPLVWPMMGHSTGRWDAETLVVTTRYISDLTLLDAVIPHSDALTLTERLRLIDQDTLEVRMTFDDPATFTHPWEAVVIYRREAEGAFREDICLDRLEAGQRPLPVE